MNENILIVSFEVESEAYQAFSQLKKYPHGSGYFASSAGILKKKNGHISSDEAFDTGVQTRDDTAKGGLIGSLIGILGGPLGVLLGGSMGALIGSGKDASDAADNASLIEQVSEEIHENGTAIVALVQEDDYLAIDRLFADFRVVITRRDAAEVAAEIEEAQKIQKEMEKEARKKLREEKKAEKAQKIEAKRQEIRDHFSKLDRK